ncbi:hypothetical protein C5167_033870 [Papaver somniferum]|uniref:Uncharacterized protein n=1 Tax=Papaver somniferum TaxID=3469 RepID=A0A4Y7KFC0_PAPSO|nr:hypothetical protein C5167_033870 [Papaver somniferum]
MRYMFLKAVIAREKLGDIILKVGYVPVTCTISYVYAKPG